MAADKLSEAKEQRHLHCLFSDDLSGSQFLYLKVGPLFSVLPIPWCYCEAARVAFCAYNLITAF